MRVSIILALVLYGWGKFTTSGSGDVTGEEILVHVVDSLEEMQLKTLTELMGNITLAESQKDNAKLHDLTIQLKQFVHDVMQVLAAEKNKSSQVKTNYDKLETKVHDLEKKVKLLLIRKWIEDLEMDTFPSWLRYAHLTRYNKWLMAFTVCQGTGVKFFQEWIEKYIPMEYNDAVQQTAKAMSNLYDGVSEQVAHPFSNSKLIPKEAKEIQAVCELAGELKDPNYHACKLVIESLNNFAVNSFTIDAEITEYGIMYGIISKAGDMAGIVKDLQKYFATSDPPTDSTKIEDCKLDNKMNTFKPFANKKEDLRGSYIFTFLLRCPKNVQISSVKAKIEELIGKFGESQLSIFCDALNMPHPTTPKPKAERSTSKMKRTEYGKSNSRPDQTSTTENKVEQAEVNTERKMSLADSRSAILTNRKNEGAFIHFPLLELATTKTSAPYVTGGGGPSKSDAPSGLLNGDQPTGKPSEPIKA